ncbi:Fpg/Nei family DNA glycosylase [Nocardioides sp. TRM66260-LWL]|uniref:DNA-formamidopyrimidine glycosylase family protein n=1 Tax=Nocardioides sp. TRM66260-LWL TaxID=2874478 RepID=UPI001CC45452|nr:DNA-formamidopyrimidine glycosylase family protein [Nocardioides sp. TRM66260-LWL]MBZ5733773.1 Fpg/Nei family DNA glycosylase [Nocardioides sp. TRM66260-LWL]
MPEGDTVYRAARLLDRGLAGRTLTRTDLRVPSLATVDLVGGLVRGTASYGKHLLTRIDHDDLGAWTLHTHLRMEGSWRLFRPGQPWSRPEHQARVVLGADRVLAVGFSLGVVELVPRSAEGGAIGHLGPDLLGDFDEAEALRRLTADPERPIGEALRDQRNLAGLGNMYVAELLFVSGVHPMRPVGEIADRLPRMVRRGRQMLDLNKERAIQTTTGDLRDRERHWVYRRDTAPCRRCGGRIRVEQQGPAGQERTVYFCPTCQT